MASSLDTSVTYGTSTPLRQQVADRRHLARSFEAGVSVAWLGTHWLRIKRPEPYPTRPRRSRFHSTRSRPIVKAVSIILSPPAKLPTPSCKTHAKEHTVPDGPIVGLMHLIYSSLHGSSVPSDHLRFYLFLAHNVAEVQVVEAYCQSPAWYAVRGFRRRCCRLAVEGSCLCV